MGGDKHEDRILLKSGWSSRGGRGGRGRQGGEGRILSSTSGSAVSSDSQLTRRQFKFTYATALLFFSGHTMRSLWDLSSLTRD